MCSHTSLRDMAWGGFPNATGDGLDQGPAAYKMTLNFDETAFITRNLLAGGTGYKQDWDGVGEQSEEASLMDQFIDDQNRINLANETVQGGNT